MFLGFVFIRNMIILSFTGSYPVTENMHSLCGIYICIASSGKNHLISTKFGTQIRIWNLVSHNDQTWKFLRFKVADDFLQSFWAITRQPIVRFQWSFVQRSRIEWLLQSRDINSKFQKFKLANGRHIANRNIAVSQQRRSSAVAERPCNVSCHCVSLSGSLFVHWNCMSVSCTVSEIFSVKEWSNFENRGRGRSRSLKMVPFDRP